MFHYFYKIYFFTIILCSSNIFNNNTAEIGTYTLSCHNGRIQFRMLAQKKANKKPSGNILTKLWLKDNKTKNPDPQISSLVSLVDNMNITEEKKDKIKTLTLKYINSDDIKEKNKSINELKNYSRNEECKEHMDNYLMHLCMQNDMKYLKRKNLWNNIWIISLTLFLIILIIVLISLGKVLDQSGILLTFLSIFMIYIFARFFPDIKVSLKQFKETCTNFFKKKSK
ncbi:MC-2TM Maurer's cleft two transmembrane protein [Plasmodium reichenowi]|uniref:MC-2TM Maurer's cleft two transmembrane protein n=1 Tax=Plasmodium reichenowi TaxID=5854 RepID=A0A060RMC5_PLARE|nr:MC-2TM Maurer's cleft two transmembrane protein [Plasmodium reichenowi]